MISGTERALHVAARATLLTAARDGDDSAFVDLVRPHGRALHLHCYRMLGSLTEAGEVTGEAMFRARRGLRGYRAEECLHRWLMRTTTVACLRADVRRARRPRGRVPMGRVPMGRVPMGLQPYPRALLDQLTAEGPDPAADPGERASLAMPFVAALQLLPAPQRAAALLHEVLGWPLEDVARTLGVPVTAAGRSWERARESLSAALGGWPASDARRSPLLPDD